jgi:hypothetical protein
MKIFISWSGERARAVATELRSWIAMILQATKPWMSDRDLGSGVNWSAEIAKQLDGSSVGIICVTPERMNAPWLLFESGAIAKKLDDARVIPYLVDLSPTGLTGPLSQFQAREANKEGTLRLLLDINKHLPEPRDEEEVKKMFESFWGQLAAVVDEQLETGNPIESQEPERTDKDILEEVLLLVRENAREISELREAVTDKNKPRGTVNVANAMSPDSYRESFKVEMGYDPALRQALLDEGVSYAAPKHPSASYSVLRAEVDYLLSILLQDPIIDSPRKLRKRLHLAIDQNLPKEE